VTGNPGFKLSCNQNSRLASILIEDPHIAIWMSSSEGIARFLRQAFFGIWIRRRSKAGRC